jgi:K+-transporting ATPase ATPase A chain
MNTEIIGIAAMFLITVLAAIPLGKYIGKIYMGEPTWPDRIFNPIDKLFYRLGGIRPEREMNWKQHLTALLTINLVWFLFSMLVLMNMSWLPLNPDGNPSMPADLAFNTTVSFVSNTNLQHYSGETGVSYLGQLVLMLFQFISAGAGMAACAAVFNAMRERTTEKLGNFYNYFVCSCTRVLLPLSIIVATILAFNGTPMTFHGKDQFISMQGDTVHVRGYGSHQAAGHEWRWVFWRQFGAAHGEPQLSHEYDGGHQHRHRSHGHGLCPWLYREAEEAGMDGLRRNDGGVPSLCHSGYLF